MVGVRDVCMTCGKGGLSRSEQLVRYLWRAPSSRGLLSGSALTGAVCCASQYQPSLFASAASAWPKCQQWSRFIEDTVEPSSSCPGLSPSCA